MDHQDANVFRTYKVQIDDDIAKLSQKLKDRWQLEYGLDTSDVLEAYVTILSRGGKRFRGALGMWAYYTAGGADKALAVQLGRLLEMTHAYLLVIDDIADEAATRRSGPSAHKLLESHHRQNTWFGRPEHFGTSQAMNAALAALHIVMQEMTEMPAHDSNKLEALRELNLTLTRTVIGQIADINHEVIRSIEEHEVIKMMLQKTAYYSFVNPLQLGIIFGNQDFGAYKWLENWGRNIGLSFQLQDDILGLFGDDKKTGKSKLDDFREGKITLLIVRALAHSSEAQKSQLLSLLGNHDIAEADISLAQKIVEDTGALDYCQRLLDSYAKKAISALDGAPDELKEKVTFLHFLSHAITTRSS